MAQKPSHSERFTIEELALVCGLSVRTLRRYVRDGQLPVIRRKSKVFVTLDAAAPLLEKWLRGIDCSAGTGRFFFVTVREYAALAGMSGRQVRSLIEKQFDPKLQRPSPGSLQVVRRGGRIFVNAIKLVDDPDADWSALRKAIGHAPTESSKSAPISDFRAIGTWRTE